MKYVVAQMSARMHYAVPQILARAGHLERLYTDIYATRGVRTLARMLPMRVTPQALVRLSGRRIPDVPTRIIRSFPAFGLDYALRLSRCKNESQRVRTFLWAGRKFTGLAIKEGFGEALGVYTFNSAALELLETARKDGLTGVVEQTIAPLGFAEELLAEERERHPDWEEIPESDDALETYAQREQAEWQEADVILCGSAFVREGIAHVGGPAEKCVVVPYGVDLAPDTVPRTNRTGPLRVLTVGTLGLRKGTPYVLESAKLLGTSASFRMVGPVNVSPKAERTLRAHVELTGPVPRASIASHYHWADVFLLPSLCEGSATVTYEAMASGLPVVTTPNAGSLVKDQVDGFIVPIRNTSQIAASLELLHKDRERLAEMSRCAATRTADVSLNAYGERLIAALATRKSAPLSGNRL